MTQIPPNSRTSRVIEALTMMSTAMAAQHIDDILAAQTQLDAAEAQLSVAQAACRTEKQQAGSLRELKQAIAAVVFLVKRTPGLAEFLPVGYDAPSSNLIALGKSLVANLEKSGRFADAVSVVRECTRNCERSAARRPPAAALDACAAAMNELRVRRDALEYAKRTAETYVKNNTAPDSPARLHMHVGRGHPRSKKKSPSTIVARTVTAAPAPNPA